MSKTSPHQFSLKQYELNTFDFILFLLFATQIHKFLLKGGGEGRRGQGRAGKGRGGETMGRGGEGRGGEGRGGEGRGGEGRSLSNNGLYA